MSTKSRRTFLLAALAFVVVFITSGYLLSDGLFFKQLIRQNRITTPEEAFAFVENNTHPATLDMKLTILTTPRNMLTRQKYLYCDQSAMVMATIVRQLGYETRLVDLVGDDGVSHHTILEVKQNGGWKTYDTLQNLQGVTYEQSAASLNSVFYKHTVKPIYRPYPELRHRVIQNNFYLKHVALRLRGLPG